MKLILKTNVINNVKNSRHMNKHCTCMQRTSRRRSAAPATPSLPPSPATPSLPPPSDTVALQAQAAQAFIMLQPNRVAAAKAAATWFYRVAAMPVPLCCRLAICMAGAGRDPSVIFDGVRRVALPGRPTPMWVLHFAEGFARKGVEDMHKKQAAANNLFMFNILRHGFKLYAQDPSMEWDVRRVQGLHGTTPDAAWRIIQDGCLKGERNAPPVVFQGLCGRRSGRCTDRRHDDADSP